MRRNISQFITFSIPLIYLAIVLFCCLYDFSGTDLSISMTYFGIPTDKIVHFIMFLPYPFVAWMFLNFNRIIIINNRYILSAIIISGFFLASFAEASQKLFTTWRSLDSYDLLANLSGIITGSLIIYLIKLFYNYFSMKFVKSKMRILFLVIILCFISFNCNAKEDINKENNKRGINLKLSAFVAVGIVNPAIEIQIQKKSSIQLEGLGVFYSSNFLGTNKPLVLGATFVEYRYFYKDIFKGFYFGPNIGWGVYKLNKGLVIRYTDTYNYDCYQHGSNIMCGASIGYVFRINDAWSIDINWCGGFQHSRYQGYTRNKETGIYDMYVDLNSSAEWPPFYKGGIFICYKF